MCTVERLRELFSYDPATGVLLKLRLRGRGKAGSIAGKMRDGYRVVCADYQQYPAHRVAWAIHYGEWPNGEVDHKDRNRSNNRIDNLRIATPFQNRGNVVAYRNNRSGLKGVHWHPQSSKWRAMIRRDGRSRHIGLYNTKEEAAAAYDQAAIEQFGEFARVNFAA